MDNLDRIREILQCLDRLYNECPVMHEHVSDDIDTITNDILLIKDELIELKERHAQWIGNMFCSHCNRFPVYQGMPFNDLELTKYFEYCPHCGAKMDEGAEQ